jgi:hypothetical protein
LQTLVDPGPRWDARFAEEIEASVATPGMVTAHMGSHKLENVSDKLNGFWTEYD